MATELARKDLPQKYVEGLIEEAMGLSVANLMALAVFIKSLDPTISIKEVYARLNDVDYLFSLIEAIEEVLDGEK